MQGSAQPEDRAEDRFPPASTEDTIAGTDRSFSVGAVDDKSNGSRAFEETELDSALQLLVERAQYITGATGAALALPHGEEMVCRASAGSSAPAVGARLQVRSGLSAESIARRQLLRCNNAESDPRVNLEACRALGIASIVVLPLLHRSGEVRGLFELFSDHPYAFEERDLIALERMADLTLTALDLAEQRPNPAPAPTREATKPAELSPEPLPLPEFLPELSTASGASNSEPTSEQGIPAIPLQSQSAEELLAELSVIYSPSPVAAPAVVPEAMLRVQKCASCGFPVSEGRTLCLDCEKKDREKKDAQKKPGESKLREQEQDTPSGAASLAPEEFVPAFLVNAGSAPESWLANHVNLLAIVVLILGILIAVVVFR